MRRVINMGFIEYLITDESQICFANGEKVTGAKDVSEVILKCCEQYNTGYMGGRNVILYTGIFIGGLVAGTAIGVSQLINHKKKAQK